jgi:hypothetical protein
MKDVMEVLRLKERELIEVKRQVEALRVVAPLLQGNENSSPSLGSAALMKDGGFSA